MDEQFEWCNAFALMRSQWKNFTGGIFVVVGNLITSNFKKLLFTPVPYNLLTKKSLRH